jgi:hypothetical protein
MTDPDDLDDLASAHLDGATTDEEAARVESDAALRARVEELRAVRDAVAAVPPVDSATRDRTIAAALTALAEDGRSAPPAPVVPLTPRRGLSPRAVRAIGAAAVILLVGLLVPLLARDDQGDDDETASFDTAEDAIDEAGDGAEGGDVSAPTGAAGGGTAGTLAPDAGTFEDMDALASAIASRPLEERAGPDSQLTPSTTGPALPPCSAPPELGTLVAHAVVAGEAVAVYVRRDADGRRTMSVLSRASCEQLDQRALD